MSMLRSTTWPGYLWYFSSFTYAANNNSEQENTIHIYLCGIVSVTCQWTAFICAQWWSRKVCFSPEHVQKKSLLMKLISQKLFWWPWFLMQEKTAEVECMWKIVKKIVEAAWKFPLFRCSFPLLQRVFSISGQWIMFLVF